jgi:hypothetical protein
MGEPIRPEEPNGEAVRTALEGLRELDAGEVARRARVVDGAEEGALSLRRPRRRGRRSGTQGGSGNDGRAERAKETRHPIKRFPKRSSAVKRQPIKTK